MQNVHIGLTDRWQH